VALLVALVAITTSAITPDGADAARTRGRSSIKLMCAQLEGTYQEYSDGSYSCYAGGWFTYCDPTGWCETFCFDGLGCDCSAYVGAYDECVGGPHVKINADQPRWVIEKQEHANASAEDPAPNEPAAGSVSAATTPVVGRSSPNR